MPRYNPAHLMEISTTRNRRLLVPALLAVGLLVCPLIQAQTTIEPAVTNPGARSLGLGGAFVAVADDATAAWANPSGLVQLLRPEISLEGRSWSEDRAGEASNQSGVGFLSFVLPLKPVSLAIYGQTLTSLDFADDSWRYDSGFSPLTTLIIANAGISAGVSVSEKLSIGFGIVGFAGISTAVDIEAYSNEDISTDTGVLAGGMWNLSQAWAIGVSYRSGADFRFDDGSMATVPDILALGARWRSAGGNGTVACEIERLDGLEKRTRIHLGGEWVVLSTKPLIGLRAGLWHDPEGGIVGIDQGDELLEGEDLVHFSAGIGIAFKKFQIDFGADLSDRTTISSLSMIFTF